VVLKSGKTGFKYRLRRATGEDWLSYYTGVTNKTINIGAEREEIFDADTALIELVDSLLIEAEGYGELPKKDWQQAIPFRHRRAIGVVLRNVGPETRKAGAQDELVPETQEVRLAATWPVDGKTLYFSGLVHRFRRPGIKDLKRFNTEISAVRTRGTGTDGITTRPAQQAVAMRLYDELIESVEGYQVNGKPLEGADAIKREMDGAHKAAAALELFLGGDDVTIE
jgi:hypothetical protein